MTLCKSPPPSRPRQPRGQSSSHTLAAALVPGAGARVPPSRRGASHPGVHSPHGSLSGCCPAEVPAPTPAQLQTQTRDYRSRKLRAERRHLVPPRARPLTLGPPLIGPYETVTRMFTRTPGSASVERAVTPRKLRVLAKLVCGKAMELSPSFHGSLPWFSPWSFSSTSKV